MLAILAKQKILCWCTRNTFMWSWRAEHTQMNISVMWTEVNERSYCLTLIMFQLALGFLPSSAIEFAATLFTHTWIIILKLWNLLNSKDKKTNLPSRWNLLKFGVLVKCYVRANSLTSSGSCPTHPPPPALLPTNLVGPPSHESN